jgi:hypothetical protein
MYVNIDIISIMSIIIVVSLVVITTTITIVTDISSIPVRMRSYRHHQLVHDLVEFVVTLLLFIHGVWSIT